jgi:hypothetical protein
MDSASGRVTENLRRFRRVVSCSTRECNFRLTSSRVQHFRRYMSVLPDHNGVPRVIMRHAVPNSPDRIKMIGAALKSCKIPIKRVRMLSLLTRHGFNEEETMFVEQQRCFESTFSFLHSFDIVQFNFCNVESHHICSRTCGEF